MNYYKFPQQKVICEERTFSHELLHSLLETVYAASPPFNGYLKIAEDASSLHFLFFFKGAPYAAGKFTGGKPIDYSIKELARHLASSADGALSVTLCETDPVLLKNMLLFLKEVPEAKAPVSLIDIEHIVRQIGEGGTNAMIALCRDDKFNFFFFKDGKGALAYYSDLTFKRPDGMAIDEEMLLYAFQPGDNVQAFIFRDMVTAMEEDSNLLDKDSLYKLLTAGFLNNRRREDSETSPTPLPAKDGIKVLVNALCQETKLQSVELSVESGDLQGERYTVTLPCTIGRRDCDLTLEDRRISRRHAELKVIDNKLVIEDLASKNGIKVNGEYVTKKGLFTNDLISIGPTNLRIIIA